MSVQLYVYYRVATEHVDAALIAFRKARVEAPIELLQRPEPDAEGHWTWMEIYPEGWTHREPQVAVAMAQWLASERKVERFEMLG
ncbi:DUF4936 family protein [Pelomonas aquatica]|jgi:hypothetical protein|uniref:DUF4936 family protein n=1 Tax=Pelomonas aquatica TaxID=431058 RepID=A0A9X4LE43_9BURK|nr:DUF4936 family protein [Pelomonas aquatica]MCY4755103.1 DUF4936 family protein [Pelomonas aquatica]MDG0860882.1 DUF4936 family protein [Pelomonas aquatica]